GARPSHRATITVQQRMKHGGIGWIITGELSAAPQADRWRATPGCTGAQYGTVAVMASNAARRSVPDRRLTRTPAARKKSSGQGHLRALSTLFIMICQSLLARNLDRTRHGARR